MKTFCLVLLTWLTLSLTVQAAPPAKLPMRPGALPAPRSADVYLTEGHMAEGLKVVSAQLQQNPEDDQLRFNMGILQFVHGIEHLSQSLYRYGLRSERGREMGIPFLRLPLPQNPHPDEMDYPAARAILQDLVDDLGQAEATLAPIRSGDVKVPIRVGLIRLDLNGNGVPEASLRQLLVPYVGGEQNLPKDPDLLVAFDRADVAWFRGYCHLLMAQAEIALAYDGQELFDCTAHIFFARPKTPHAFLLATDGKDFYHLGGGVDIVDLIAFIHLIRLPVHEPARMTAALQHLDQMLALSQETWKLAMAETDDDHEWLPNAHQHGVLGVQVTQEMIDSWLSFVDEARSLLAGQRLVPFWRKGESRGVNLHRVFTEPRPLDLVLWVQGTAATPYLENGELTRPEVWSRLTRVFQGNFPGFAIWFN